MRPRKEGHALDLYAVKADIFPLLYEEIDFNK